MLEMLLRAVGFVSALSGSASVTCDTCRALFGALPSCWCPELRGFDVPSVWT